MAAYRRDDLEVTCGLTTCTPGSAPGPTLGNEYRITLPSTGVFKLVNPTVSFVAVEDGFLPVSQGATSS